MKRTFRLTKRMRKPGGHWRIERECKRRARRHWMRCTRRAVRPFDADQGAGGERTICWDCAPLCHQCGAADATTTDLEGKPACAFCVLPEADARG